MNIAPPQPRPGASDAAALCRVLEAIILCLDAMLAPATPLLALRQRLFGAWAGPVWRRIGHLRDGLAHLLAFFQTAGLPPALPNRPCQDSQPRTPPANRPARQPNPPSAPRTARMAQPDQSPDQPPAHTPADLAPHARHPFTNPPNAPRPATPPALLRPPPWPPPAPPPGNAAPAADARAFCY